MLLYLAVIYGCTQISSLFLSPKLRRHRLITAAASKSNSPSLPTRNETYSFFKSKSRTILSRLCSTTKGFLICLCPNKLTVYISISPHPKMPIEPFGSMGNVPRRAITLQPNQDRVPEVLVCRRAVSSIHIYVYSGRKDILLIFAFYRNQMSFILYVCSLIKSIAYCKIRNMIPKLV